MALTKATSVLDAIASYASATTTKGTAASIEDAYQSSLLVYFAPDSTTATTVAAEAHIQVSPDASGDDSWVDHVTLQYNTTTAESEALTGTEAAGSTVLEMASTTNLTRNMKILIKNSTVANSEFAEIASVVTNTSATVIDGITNAQTGSTVFNQADRRKVSLPFDAKRTRVIYYAPTGPSVCWMTKLVKVTAV